MVNFAYIGALAIHGGTRLPNVLSKMGIEMTIKSLDLTNLQWLNIRHKMMDQYGPSILISLVQRRKLGFVARSKENWRDGVYIDFWEEKYKTQFILKWL
jgi:hypothetical protein